jgi:hypothetical protein
VDPTEFGFGLGVVCGLLIGAGTGLFLVCVLALRDAWLARSGWGMPHRKPEDVFE